jgi:hypothetical protein
MDKFKAPAHLCTTFQRLHDADACPSGYGKLARYIRDQLAVTPQDYGMNRPIPLAIVAESNDADDTFWVLRNAMCEDEDGHRAKMLRLLACDFAERAMPIFEKKYPDDKRPHEAIRMARLFANGECTATELEEARKGARSAAYADAAAYAAADYAADYAAADYAAAAYAAAAADYAAAYAAADYAADYAAADYAAARLTEKQWQFGRLREALAAESERFATTFCEGSEAVNEEAA